MLLTMVIMISRALNEWYPVIPSTVCLFFGTIDLIALLADFVSLVEKSAVPTLHFLTRMQVFVPD